MKYIKTQRLFFFKKKGERKAKRKEEKDGAIHRLEKNLMRCIRQPCHTPAVELKRRACTLIVYSAHTYIYIHMSQSRD